MKKLLILSAVVYLISINTNSQVTFNKENYFNFLKNNDGMNVAQAEQLYPLAKTYYMGKENSLSPEVYDYYDTVKFKMSLTDDEILLLKRNGFVVTERKSYNRFLDAFDDIYYKDLPVFVSTDAILFALHSSYDNILKQMEVNLLEPNVILIASQMYNNVPSIIEKYKNIPELLKALHDIDLYITVAQSLITGTESNMHYPSDSSAHNILKLIKLQNPVQLKLFCDTFRYIDFSQFKPHGSYLGKFYKPSGKYETLENYFKTTMWLGRIDFWLTPPDSTWKKSDIKQMNFDALLLNELLDLSDSRKLLNENDKIISFLIGQSDNFTPTQIESTKENLNISDASALINDPTYSTWISNLKSASVFGQRIMSDIIICDSTTDRPIVLPVSFKLFGQRFIIDSYVMANVVFDRVINKGKKEIRLMPSPLDVLFALGNNNALPILQKDIDTYHYSLQLLAMRQLIDGYDNPFWHETLYNNWLQAIRQINPTADSSGLPFFMSSAAWQHEKMNTQLSSYTQLRHDNLLYAKPSYTGATTICSYPYSFVEPYPEFYKQIALFADSAKTFFSKYTTKNSSVINYFDKLNSIMSTLEDISRKEISDQTLTVDEISFLKKMYSKNEDNMCGAQPISGWYYDLLFGNGEETIIADIHTQPTDSDGNMVGKVLHIASGKVNLGIFLASSTFPNKHNIVFVGPVMSYYEKTTENFNRNTDQDWQTAVANGNSGYRPDWVNIYLADKNGKMLTEGRVLPYMIKDWVDVPEMKDEKGIDARIYPNPFYNNPFIIIKSEKAAVYSYSIYDQCGKIVYQSELKRIPNGKTIDYFNNANLKQGFYICNVKLGSTFKNIKIVKQ